jgi:hypothetical protein
VIVFTRWTGHEQPDDPRAVSAIASEIDVPVYVMTVALPSTTEDQRARARARAPLRTLARWTGGDCS